MANLAQRLAVLELRPTESSVLLIIDANPNVTQSEIGRMLDIARANMAPLISRLEARDLLEREPMDGRSHGLNLSAAGRRLTSRVKKVVQAHEAALLAKIPADERTAFVAGLRALWSSKDEQDN